MMNNIRKLIEQDESGFMHKCNYDMHFPDNKFHLNCPISRNSDVARSLAPNVCSDESCAYLLDQLSVAKENITPVIDHIINHASIFTNTDFTSNYNSCCYLTGEQFGGAIIASRILNSVNDNLNKIEEIRSLNLPGVEVIVNTAACVSDCVADPSALTGLDRIYIDKDLIRQLIELHEFMGMTIYRLRDMQVCRSNFIGPPRGFSIPSDKRGVKRNIGGACSPCCARKKSPRRNKSNQSYPVKSSQSREVRAYPCCCYSKRKKCPPTSGGPTPRKTKSRSAIIKPITTCSTPGNATDDACSRELVRLQREYDELSATLNALQCGTRNPSRHSFSVSKTSMRGDSRHSVRGNSRTSFKGSKTSLGRGSKSSMHQMSTTGHQKSRSKSCTNVSDSKINSLQQAKQTILDCLAELSEVRKFLREVCKLEASLESSIEIQEEPCGKECCRQDTNHIHAKLNGIPVVLKMNKRC